VTILEAPNDIALIVLDMVMPEMSGAETLARIRQIAPEVPVIVASGYTLRSTGETLHPDDFLQKPFTSVDLERKVRDLLARSRSQPRVRSGAGR
jgi:CheY-like chemotaxis protein